MSSMEFPQASAADIIRSNQRDQFIIKSLGDHGKSVIEDIISLTRNRHWRQWWIRIMNNNNNSSSSTGVGVASALAGLLYFFLTTGLNNRTIGEEYVDIFQVEYKRNNNNNIAMLVRWKKRLMYIIGVTMIPYFATSGKIKGNNNNNNRAIIKQLIMLHLAIFYMSGKYYHFSKRVLGLRYIMGHRGQEQQQSSSGGTGYEVLGVLIFLQLAVQVISQLRESSSERNDESISESKESIKSASHDDDDIQMFRIKDINLKDPNALPYIQPDQARICTLCLELMINPTATTCGHIFCWTCISEWTRAPTSSNSSSASANCPLCRQQIFEQSLLPLQ